MKHGMELPTEILFEIVAYLSSSPSNLARCARVNRALGECALVVLYRNIDLRRVDKGEEEKVTEKISVRRLHTVSEKPSIGRLVQSICWGMSDGTDIDGANNGKEGSILVGAVRNMRALRRAHFWQNPFAMTILESPNSYPNLQSLSYHVYDPFKRIWGNITLPLKYLTLEFLVDYREEKLWKLVSHIFNVIAATCPDLESLDILCENRLTFGPAFRADSSDELPEHDFTSITSKRGLRNLQHFGFEGGSRKSESVTNDELKAGVLRVIECYRHSLTSLTLSIPGLGLQKTLNYVLRACAMVPKLKALNLVEDSESLSAVSRTVSSYAYLKELTSTVAKVNPLLERISMTSIGVPFSASVGTLFTPWQNLKFLHLGDGDNGDGPFISHGRIDFEGYRPLLFIQELPSTLEELYLEINGRYLWVDVDEDFDPVCNIGTQIFKALPRLHTCDIAAWISNLDDGFGYIIPEKAVHWRRLRHVPRPGEPSPATNKVKDIWKSRMDCIHQKDDPRISHEKCTVVLKDDEGVFEGKDAKEIWLGGDPGVNPYDYNVDTSWPFWGDLVHTYPMYERRWMLTIKHVFNHGINRATLRSWGKQ